MPSFSLSPSPHVICVGPPQIDPGTEYELHLLAEEVDENPGVIIIYFAATDSGFGKAQSITKLLADFKVHTYDMTQERGWCEGRKERTQSVCCNRLPYLPMVPLQ